MNYKSDLKTILTAERSKQRLTEGVCMWADILALQGLVLTTAAIVHRQSSSILIRQWRLSRKVKKKKNLWWRSMRGNTRGR